jgi:hypothetical protein
LKSDARTREKKIQGSFIMNLSTKVIAVTALTGVLAMAYPGAVQAQDLSPGSKTMKPLYAVSFDVGRKHVLSYFLKKGGQCDLTMMVTDRPDQTLESDGIPTLSTAKFKAEITGGKTVLFGFGITEGRALEYACATGAQAMSVRQVYAVAVSSPPLPPLYPHMYGASVKMAGLGLGG